MDAENVAPAVLNGLPTADADADSIKTRFGVRARRRRVEAAAQRLQAEALYGCDAEEDTEPSSKRRKLLEGLAGVAAPGRAKAAEAVAKAKTALTAVRCFLEAGVSAGAQRVRQRFGAPSPRMVAGAAAPAEAPGTPNREEAKALAAKAAEAPTEALKLDVASLPTPGKATAGLAGVA
eukprot:TRINITY_DN64382_c0_g1_i1.p1 TRINITY_DN64382_c0_g1~~TRINITY_DN64382_c0_g1_i1.p1  ORF type:complete len:206 (+),score=61.58 TRINITY_DN64382_c0_g1_i1:85-618(+)